MSNADFHFSRTIPIALLIGLVSQFVYMIWSTAVYKTETNARLETIETWKSETIMSDFTTADAALLRYRVGENQQSIAAIEHKLDVLIADMASVKSALDIPNHSPVTMGPLHNL